MTCQTCGRPAENGTPTHWLGCPGVEGVKPQDLSGEDPTGGPCECSEGCTAPKKPWSGKGAKPKYAEGHKKEK